jgi:hypothetical protein
MRSPGRDRDAGECVQQMADLLPGDWAGDTGLRGSDRIISRVEALRVWPEGLSPGRPPWPIPHVVEPVLRVQLRTLIFFEVVVSLSDGVPEVAVEHHYGDRRGSDPAVDPVARCHDRLHPTSVGRRPDLSTGSQRQDRSAHNRSSTAGPSRTQAAQRQRPLISISAGQGPYLHLVAGRGFEPLKLSRRIYSPLPLAARATRQGTPPRRNAAAEARIAAPPGTGATGYGQGVVPLVGGRRQAQTAGQQEQKHGSEPVV